MVTAVCYTPDGQVHNSSELSPGKYLYYRARINIYMLFGRLHLLVQLMGIVGFTVQRVYFLKTYLVYFVNHVY